MLGNNRAHENLNVGTEPCLIGTNMHVVFLTSLLRLGASTFPPEKQFIGLLLHLGRQATLGACIEIDRTMRDYDKLCRIIRVLRAKALMH